MPPLKNTQIFGFFTLALLVFSACRFWQRADGEIPNPTPFTAEELKSETPFSAKEPNVFQAEIVVTANNRESKTFAARNENRRRYDYNLGAKNRLSVLQTDKNYLLLPDKKIYAESVSTEKTFVSGGWTDFLTTEWLNAKTDVKFFKLAAENNLAKYRVVFGDAENAESESLIYLDEAKNLIVKQEFYGASGEQKTLTMTVELKNLKLEAEADLFVLPKNYRKVPLEEFRRILQSENNDE